MADLSALVDAGQTPPAPRQDDDKPLTPLEQQGFAAFQAHCIVCHGDNARHEMSFFPFPSNFIPVLVSERNRAGLEVRDYDVANPDGTVTRVRSPDLVDVIGSSGKNQGSAS